MDEHVSTWKILALEGIVSNSSLIINAVEDMKIYFTSIDFFVARN